MERLSDYDYHLPEELIAQVPLEDRSASRLLVLDRATGKVSHGRFRDLGRHLGPGDLLVLNDTRVSAVRLVGHRASGGHVEALLTKRLSPNRYVALTKPAKRLRPGTRIGFGEGLEAEVETVGEGGERTLRFVASGDVSEQLASAGRTPLPPYIHTVLNDPARYQTVYSREEGSSAAPTAGLHFTQGVLDELRREGIGVAWVTLDVGIDTFRPVMAEVLDEHVMHGETCRVPEASAEAIAQCRGRIVAVGTTTVRTLETMATGPRQVRSGAEQSKLFIRPGYPFQVVDAMLTNFHLPRTTMLMMISAMAGREAVFEAYRQAIEERYRFLSFGDAMLIL
ncbi:MAG: tRNA preQ1(34) S-adenosylmethionine ribosyltransferase-isomerase QueA [Armatimonadetes bacterium]|nr:tRNA preQ1(34) S-adenosylmethionine ribosyltransferase-isomerase QueA [Armatimonadota bacterium]